MNTVHKTKKNQKPVELPAPTAFTIITRYYKASGARFMVKQNRAKYPYRAVERVVHHMQFNTYDAMYAEVYDEETGEVHAQIKRSIDGSMRITLLRDPITLKPIVKELKS